MKHVIETVNKHLAEAMTAVLGAYYNDDKVGYCVDEFTRTNDPAEKAEYLRNALDYIRKNYEETEDGQVR